MRRSGFKDRLLFVIGFLAASSLLVIKYPFTKAQTSQAIDRQGDYYKDSEQEKVARYSDQRNPNFTIVYVDEEPNGELETVFYYTKQGKRLLTVYLPRSRTYAEATNLSWLSIGDLSLLDGAPVVHFWRDSIEGKALTDKYHEVIKKYVEMNPGKNPPEYHLIRIAPKMAK